MVVVPYSALEHATIIFDLILYFFIGSKILIVPITFVSMVFCVSVSVVLADQLYGEKVPVDMTVFPGSNIQADLSVEMIYGSGEDSDSTTVTGNIITELDIFFDAGVPEVADVNSIRFTGGQLHFSDMSFTISFSILGTVYATLTGLGGYLDSPYGPVAVVDGEFDCTNHVLILNQGAIDALGTGTIGGLFDPITFDFTEEPVVLSLANMGTVSVVFESLEGNEAAYNVTLILPIDFNEFLFEVEETVRVDLAGSGVIEAHGSFVRCQLRADLAGQDCIVDEADLAVFIDQWLAFGDVNDCGLSAELYGEDCCVGLADFAVMAGEWLNNVILDN